jgi:hypothetical protein
MSEDHSAQDPLEFVSKMWANMGFSLPGMVAPTLDIDELDKRIRDLKAVEHWLKVNLNMLQMTTQGLEMQRAALAAVKAMSAQASEHYTAPASPDGEANPFATAAMWPWNFMSAQTAEPAANTDSEAEEKPKPKPKGRSGTSRGTGSSKSSDKN